MEHDAAGSSPVGAEGADDPQMLLCVESGFYAGLEWPLTPGNTVIGRGRGSDLVLSEATISRAHAVFICENGGLLVQDLDSTNGTVVNERREKQKLLQPGDAIQMGRLRLRVGVRSRPEGSPDEIEGGDGGS